MIKLQPIVQHLSGSGKTAIYFLGFFILSYSQNEFAYSQQVNRPFPRNNTPELPNIITLLTKSKIGGQGAETKGSCFTLPFISSDSITESANPVIWVYIKPTLKSQTKITISYISFDGTDRDDKAFEDFIAGADSRFKSYTIPSKVGREFSVNKKYRVTIACGSETNVSRFSIERKPSSGIPKTLHPFQLIAETAKLNLWSETIDLLFSREVKSHPDSNILFERMIKDFPFRNDVNDGRKIEMVEAFRKLKT